MHCVESVRIWSYFGLHFPVFPAAPMRENADQNNTKYGHLLRSHHFPLLILMSYENSECSQFLELNVLLC